jgi:putative transcriptional regulator
VAVQPGQHSNHGQYQLGNCRDLQTAVVQESPLTDTASMEFQGSLSNQLLIAMPGMADPNFNSTVTLVCEHNANGALGIIINRPMNMNLGGLFEQLDLKDADTGLAQSPVLHGGPVAPDKGFVLHDSGNQFDSTVSVSPEIQLTLSRDVLDAMASGSGPDNSLVALGYAGWDAGQLEQEMLENTWLTVPSTPEILFAVPFSERWSVAAKTIGIDISKISPHAGHA